MARGCLADGVHNAELLRAREQRRDDLGQTGRRLRRLHDHAGLANVRERQGLVGSANHHRPRRVGKRRRHLRMACLPNDDHTIPLGGELLGSAMHLLHEGTGGVHHRRAELGGLVLLRRGDPVRAEHESAAACVARVIDHRCAAAPEACHNAWVVDEGTKRANARASFVECVLGHLERALHAVAGASLAGNFNFGHGYIFPGCSSRSSSRRA